MKKIIIKFFVFTSVLLLSFGLAYADDDDEQSNTMIIPLSASMSLMECYPQNGDVGLCSGNAVMALDNMELKAIEYSEAGTGNVKVNRYRGVKAIIVEGSPNLHRESKHRYIGIITADAFLILSDPGEEPREDEYSFNIKAEIMGSTGVVALMEASTLNIESLSRVTLSSPETVSGGAVIRAALTIGGRLGDSTDPINSPPLPLPPAKSLLIQPWTVESGTISHY